MALVAAGLSFVVTIHASLLLGRLLGISTPAELAPLLVDLLGVVTGYTIFYVMAFRSRLPETPRVRDAVVDAVTTDTPIVAAAGVTVAAGTAALLAASSEFFRAFGPAMALAFIVGLGVSVTLVPAMLAVLGRWVFWPGDPRRRSRRGRHAAPARAYRRVLSPVRHLTNRAVAAAVVVVGVVLLGLPSLAVPELQLGVGFTSSLPADNPVAQASRAAADAFAPGITSPTTLLLEEKGITGMTDQLVALQRLVEQEPGVAGVVGPAQNFIGSAYNNRPGHERRGGSVLVILKSEPLDATAISDLGALRDRLPDLARQSGLSAATISIAGDTALAQGLVSSTGADLVRIAVAGIIVNLLLLVLFLRALVAPLSLLPRACSP